MFVHDLLAGKRILVTGGGTGLGRAMVQRFLELGAQAAICGRRADVLAKTKEELENATGGSVETYVCDVREPKSVTALFAAVERDLGGLDVLVNNAGIGIFGPVADMSLEDWHAVIETNVNGVFYCTKAAIPLMRKRGGGYIFNVSSLAGRNTFPGGAAYSASKHAVNGFSETLFQEVREDGIRVTYLMPGSVATEFGRGGADKAGWALLPVDVGEMVVDLLHTSPRALHSRVEMRPARPQKR